MPILNTVTKELPKPIEHFKDMHYSRSNGWINDVAQQRYEEMLQCRTSLSTQEDGSNSGNITEGDIVDDVLGTRPSYRKGWGSIPRMKAAMRPRQKKSASSQDASYSTSVIETMREQLMRQEQIVQGLLATLGAAGFNVHIPSPINIQSSSASASANTALPSPHSSSPPSCMPPPPPPPSQ